MLANFGSQMERDDGKIVNLIDREVPMANLDQESVEDIERCVNSLRIVVAGTVEIDYLLNSEAAMFFHNALGGAFQF